MSSSSSFHNDVTVALVLCEAMLSRPVGHFRIVPLTGAAGALVGLSASAILQKPFKPAHTVGLPHAFVFASYRSSYFFRPNQNPGIDVLFKLLNSLKLRV